MQVLPIGMVTGTPVPLDIEHALTIVAAVPPDAPGVVPVAQVVPLAVPAAVEFRVQTIFGVPSV